MANLVDFGEQCAGGSSTCVDEIGISSSQQHSPAGKNGGANCIAKAGMPNSSPTSATGQQQQQAASERAEVGSFTNNSSASAAAGDDHGDRGQSPPASRACQVNERVGAKRGHTARKGRTIATGTTEQDPTSTTPEENGSGRSSPSQSTNSSSISSSAAATSEASGASRRSFSQNRYNSSPEPESENEDALEHLMMLHSNCRASRVSIALQTDYDEDYPPLSALMAAGMGNLSTMPILFNIAEQQQQIQPDSMVSIVPSSASSSELAASCSTSADGTLQLIIQKFRHMSDTVRGPSKFVQSVPWRIMVMPRQHVVQKKGTQKCLGFFLQCCPDAYSESWSCQASAELRLISQKAGVANFTRKTNHVYTAKENDWGYSCFMTWADILDETQGYIKDDKVILEVSVKADPPKNILSHKEFQKKIQDYKRLADMQCQRGLIDKAIECNTQALKFCKDKDNQCKVELETQKAHLIERKLKQSIERIEKGKDPTKVEDDAANLTALRHALGTNATRTAPTKEQKQEKKTTKTATKENNDSLVKGNNNNNNNTTTTTRPVTPQVTNVEQQTKQQQLMDVEAMAMKMRHEAILGNNNDADEEEEEEEEDEENADDEEDQEDRTETHEHNEDQQRKHQKQEHRGKLMRRRRRCRGGAGESLAVVAANAAPGGAGNTQYSTSSSASSTTTTTSLDNTAKELLYAENRALIAAGCFNGAALVGKSVIEYLEEKYQRDGMGKQIIGKDGTGMNCFMTTMELLNPLIGPTDKRTHSRKTAQKNNEMLSAETYDRDTSVDTVESGCQTDFARFSSPRKVPSNAASRVIQLQQYKQQQQQLQQYQQAQQQQQQQQQQHQQQLQALVALQQQQQQNEWLNNNNNNMKQQQQQQQQQLIANNNNNNTTTTTMLSGVLPGRQRKKALAKKSLQHLQQQQQTPQRLPLSPKMPKSVCGQKPMQQQASGPVGMGAMMTMDASELAAAAAAVGIDSTAIFQQHIQQQQQQHQQECIGGAGMQACFQSPSAAAVAAAALMNAGGAGGDAAGATNPPSAAAAAAMLNSATAAAVFGGELKFGAAGGAPRLDINLSALAASDLDIAKLQNDASILGQAASEVAVASGAAGSACTPQYIEEWLRYNAHNNFNFSYDTSGKPYFSSIGALVRHENPNASIVDATNNLMVSGEQAVSMQQIVDGSMQQQSTVTLNDMNAALISFDYANMKKVSQRMASFLEFVESCPNLRELRANIARLTAVIGEEIAGDLLSAGGVSLYPDVSLYSVINVGDGSAARDSERPFSQINNDEIQEYLREIGSNDNIIANRLNAIINHLSSGGVNLTDLVSRVETRFKELDVAEKSLWTERAEAKAKETQLTKQVADLQKSLQSANERSDRLNQQLKDRKNEIKKLEKKAKSEAQLTAENTELHEKMDLLKKEVSHLHRQISEEQVKYRRDTQSLADSKKHFQFELNARVAEVQKLNNALDDKTQALKKSETQLANERKTNAQTVSALMERTRKAEINFLEHKLEDGTKILERARDDCQQHLMTCDEQMKRHRTPDEQDIIKKNRKEWEKTHDEVLSLLNQVRSEFAAHINAIRNNGKQLSQLPKILIPKPPPQPKTIPMPQPAAQATSAVVGSAGMGSTSNLAQQQHVLPTQRVSPPGMMPSAAAAVFQHQQAAMMAAAVAVSAGGVPPSPLPLERKAITPPSNRSRLGMAAAIGGSAQHPQAHQQHQQQLHNMHNPSINSLLAGYPSATSNISQQQQPQQQQLSSSASVTPVKGLGGAGGGLGPMHSSMMHFQQQFHHQQQQQQQQQQQASTITPIGVRPPNYQNGLMKPPPPTSATTSTTPAMPQYHHMAHTRQSPATGMLPPHLANASGGGAHPLIGGGASQSVQQQHSFMMSQQQQHSLQNIAPGGLISKACVAPISTGANTSTATGNCITSAGATPGSNNSTGIFQTWGNCGWGGADQLNNISELFGHGRSFGPLGSDFGGNQASRVAAQAAAAAAATATIATNGASVGAHGHVGGGSSGGGSGSGGPGTGGQASAASVNVNNNTSAPGTLINDNSKNVFFP